MDMPAITTVFVKTVAVYEQLKQLAVLGGLRPGRRLVPPALAEAFGVSHTPVREALARLAAEGFVTWRAGQGYYAKAYVAGEQGDLLEVGLGLLTTSMTTIRRRQPIAMLKPLASLAPAMIEGSDAAKRVVDAVELLYVEMAKATGNVVLTQLTRLVMERTHLVRLIDQGERLTAEVTVLALNAIARALLVDDLEAAQRLAREIVRARQARLSALVGRANKIAGAARLP